MGKTLPRASEATQALLLAEWHPTKNGTKELKNYSHASGKLAWWRCSLQHEWETPVYQRYRGKGCPYCAGRRVWVGFNDLLTTEPLVAQKWDYHKNGALRPTDVTRGSTKEVWWRGECSHSWEAKVSAMVISKNGCPYCSGRKVLVGFNDLESCFPKAASFWNPTKNSKLPSEITYGSEYKAWWRCLLKHEWQAKVNDQRGQTGCPFCTGKRLLSGFNDLLTLYPDVALFWHPTKNGKKQPSDFMSGSDHEAHWLCARGHSWQARISHCTDGSSCPKCAKISSKGEEELLTWLREEQLNPTQHAKLTSDKVEVDFWLEIHKLAIEYNGVYWHSDAVRQDENFHYKKWSSCNREGITLIQVWEDEWKTRPDFIKSLIKQHLGLDSSQNDEKRSLPLDTKREFVVADNDYGEARLYEREGFAVIDILGPDFKYVFRRTRYSKEDEELLMLLRSSIGKAAHSTSSEELLLLHNMHRIWDSGKTVLRRL